MLTRSALRPINDADWVEGLCLELLRLDPLMTGPAAYLLAATLCIRPRWRQLDAAAAAYKAIEEPEAVDGV